MDVVTLGAARADAKRTYTPWHKNTVIPFGTSITKQDAVNYTDISYTIFLANLAGAWGRGHTAWANYYSGHRMRVLRNAGIGGNTTTDMLARVQTDVIAYAPGWCVYEPGPNDVVQNVGLATSKANITATCTALRNAGIGVVLCTLTPSVNFNNSTLKGYFYNLNQWIRDFARSAPGVVLCDWTAVVCDADTGDPATGMTEDGVHPTMTGAARIGRVLGSVFSGILPGSNALTSSSADSANLLSNGMMTGTGGFKANGATGTVADNWTVSGYLGGTIVAAASKVARTDDTPGFWQQVELTSGTAQLGNKNIAYTVDYTAATDIVFAEAEVEVDAGAVLTTFDLVLSFTTGGKAVSALYKYNSDTDMNYAPVPGGVLRTPAVTIPTGTQRIDVFFRFGGAGTVRASRIALRKTTAEGF